MPGGGRKKKQEYGSKGKKANDTILRRHEKRIQRKRREEKRKGQARRGEERRTEKSRVATTKLEYLEEGGGEQT